jgi:transcriptional regulator with XRE-family HTH domain
MESDAGWRPFDPKLVHDLDLTAKVDAVTHRPLVLSVPPSEEWDGSWSGYDPILPSDLGDAVEGDITRSLGYVSLNSVSNLETGREGLPAKRIYAWADILQVPRDAFFRFVTGEVEKMEMGRVSSESEKMTPAESELLAAYRRLPPKFQRRLREQAQEFEVLAGVAPAKTR